MLARRMLRFAALMAALEPCGAMAQGATEVFNSAAPSVVVVQALGAGEKNSAQGSGVVIGPEEVVTSCRVFEGAARLVVRHGGREYSAAPKHVDAKRHVCSLTVPGLAAPAAKLGSTHALRLGQKVFAIGAPQGLQVTVSEGVISALRDKGALGRYPETTAPVYPGSSGGGLFDEQGRLIGLTTFHLSEGQQLNFVIPVEWVSELPKRAEHGGAWDNWSLRATELEKRKEWDTLRDHALAWTRAQPKNPAAWLALGYAYRKMTQHAEAVEALEQALRINPQNATVWNYLGSVYYMMNQHARAIDAYQQAVEIDPQYADAWFYLGLAYANSGQNAKAIDAFQQALRADPKHGEAWYSLGNSYRRLGQHAKAIDAYQQALRIDPQHARAWNNLGNAHSDLNQYAKAIDAFQQALRINPRNARAWNNLGNAYYSLDQYAKAIDAYQQALQIDPQYANAWFNLGAAYRVQGQRGKVTEIYERLKSLDRGLADEFFSKIVLP